MPHGKPLVKKTKYNKILLICLPFGNLNNSNCRLSPGQSQSMVSEANSNRLTKGAGVTGAAKDLRNRPTQDLSSRCRITHIPLTCSTTGVTANGRPYHHREQYDCIVSFLLFWASYQPTMTMVWLASINQTAKLNAAEHCFGHWLVCHWPPLFLPPFIFFHRWFAPFPSLASALSCSPNTPNLHAHHMPSLFCALKHPHMRWCVLTSGSGRAAPRRIVKDAVGP